ncbi:MAG: thiamine diphosphokinase [Caldilineaceae bacterium]|nr:thiamine diphosphokinase [Caldilineaceae bacterium]
MRAVVFVNGDIANYAALARWLREDDYLIAADGGARHMEILGLSPAVIVGDLDSIDSALLLRMQEEGADVEQHPAAKDATDLELAIARAVRDGATEILLLGAVGGRLDQTIANLLILAQKNWAVPLTIAEGDQLARVLRGRQSVSLSGPTGGYVSAVALSEEVTGVTYRGLEYPLENATLRLGSTRGVSNTMVSSPAQVSIESGILLVIQQNS